MIKHVKRFLGLAALTVVLFLGGVTCNWACMAANRGYMPVTEPDCVPGLVLDANHVCAYEGTPLILLSDYIPAGNYVMSVGDVILSLAQLLAICIVPYGVWALVARKRPNVNPSEHHS